MSTKQINLALAAALVALTLTAHLPELKAGFIWDDSDYLTDNLAVKSAGGLVAIWMRPVATPQYYPLVFSSFWLEDKLWGLNPVGYHLDNILLHATSAVLLWILLGRLKIPAAWLAAAIFAVHPVHVESVAWISERKNCLSGVFYLSAMLAYLRAPSRYKTAVMFFVAALLSKTVTATWPIAAGIILWWQNGRLERRNIERLVPLLVIGLGMGWITAHLEQTQVGAAGHDFDWTFADRMLIAGQAVWFYALKIIWPARLVFIYPQWDLQADRLVHWTQTITAALVLILTLTSRRQIGRGAAAVALLFVVTLLPALGFVNIFPMRYSFVADHFQYLASIALIVPLAVGIQRLVTWRWGWVVLIPLAILTWQQAEIYRDSMTLWKATVAANPNSWMARHTNLGKEYLLRGDTTDAETQYRLATEQMPQHADAWWILGQFYRSVNRPFEAEAAYRQSLEVDPNFPGAIEGLKELGKER